MSDTISGIVKTSQKGPGWLYDITKPFTIGTSDIQVPVDLVRKHNLPDGATVTGSARKTKRGAILNTIKQICGLSPEVFHQRTPFRQLVAIDPNERFDLTATGNPGLRLIDLVAPIGKGTRGLIVSPPKAGKTMLLEQIAKAIKVAHPNTRIIILLVDERPEEVTHFRRHVPGEVFASSSDQSGKEHIALSEMMLGHIRTELECNNDVVVLVDSLTRMSRTFNLGGTGRGRTMSGGLEAGAIEIPRRFFGLARNIENGGSVTILATVLVDTGSRMDDLIFEEFKGTGNSEIVLDRSLAEARIFPAIDLAASSTRKEHLLYRPEDAERLDLLRRGLMARSPQEGLLALLNLVEKYETNQELLESIDIASI